MKVYFRTKRMLKLLRWRGRRAAAALRWGAGEQRSTPAVLGNAMPKSGSHLIIQVLHGLTRIGPFVDPGFPPLNRAEDNSRQPEREVLANIANMRPGDIAYGYIHAREPFISALTGPGRATVFVYRDPRDMIVSHVFYATQIHPGHGMHRYYTQNLSSMEARIEAAIRGVAEPGSELSAVHSRYQAYLGWLEQPAVLCLRFEDLILNREAAFERLLDYLEQRGYRPRVGRQQAIQALNQAVAPKKSGTYRKAQPGNWREYFSEANKLSFKQQTGDLLIRLGYETDSNWQ